MSDKNIEIRMAVTGADAAAAEVRKVENAASSATTTIESATDDAAASADDLQDRLAALRQRAENLQQDSAALAQQNENLAAKTNLARAAMAGVAIGGAIVSKTFGEIAEGIRSIDVEKLRQLNTVMADQVESVQGLAEILTDPLNGIQRLISGDTIGEAFAAINDQLARNAQIQAEAIDRLINKGILTADQLQDIARRIKAANDIIDATDSADAAQRDAADAAAIRSGANPEDIAARRAQDDAAKRIEQINRGLDPQIAQTQAAFDNAANARATASNIRQSPDATPEAIAKAEKQAAEKQAEALRLQEELQTAKAVAEQERRRVRIQAEASVQDLTFERDQRLQKEQQAAQQKAQRQAERQAAQQQRDRLTGAQDTLDTQSRAGADRIFNGGTRNPTVRRIGQALANGTDTDELNSLTREVQANQGTIPAALATAVRELLAELKATAAELDTVKAQIKNARRPK